MRKVCPATGVLGRVQLDAQEAAAPCVCLSFGICFNAQFGQREARTTTLVRAAPALLNELQQRLSRLRGTSRLYVCRGEIPVHVNV